MTGPHGEKFDFDGQPNGIYALFSTPQFAVNMKLHPEGPQTRFINEIGIIFRNASMHFDTVAFDVKMKSNMLKKKLAPFGASAIVKPFNVQVELCDGNQVTIQQRWTEISKKRFFHLDIQIEVPGW